MTTDSMFLYRELDRDGCLVRSVLTGADTPASALAKIKLNEYRIHSWELHLLGEWPNEVVEG